MIPIERRAIFLVGLGRVLKNERITLEIVGLVLGLASHAGVTVLWLLNILVY